MEQYNILASQSEQTAMDKRPSPSLNSIALHLIPLPIYPSSTFTPQNKHRIFFPLLHPLAVIAMATTFASAAIAVPSFAGLKAEIMPKTVLVKASGTNAAPAKVAGIRASTLKDVGIGAVAVATASMLLAGDAMAALVKLGDDNGGLVFEPKELVVAPGEKIVFKNNTGFPHNVLFDEDAVPAGVDASKISMGENDLLNAPGETYEVSLETKGDYEFYCAPHQGAGMVGKVTVS